MFKNPDATSTAQPVVQFPDLITYEVRIDRENWLKVQGHGAQIQDGCLMIMRGIFVDEGCNQPSVVPAGFFAPGEWRQCKTGYTGYQRRSELSIN